jgi:hypothetical protein
MDIDNYLDAMDRLQGLVSPLSRDAPHAYDRQAHHYQQMPDAIGASLVEWGHPSLTEEGEEQARLFAASESADLAHVGVEQSLRFVKFAIDILPSQDAKNQKAFRANSGTGEHGLRRTSSC